MNITDLQKEQKILVIKMILTAIFLCIICYVIHLIHLRNDEYILETSKAFKNSEVLVCNDTLIVSNSNWKLLDKHLINNNSAGYLLIENCKIKKETK